MPTETIQRFVGQGILLNDSGSIVVDAISPTGKWCRLAIHPPDGVRICRLESRRPVERNDEPLIHPLLCIPQYLVKLADADFEMAQSHPQRHVIAESVMLAFIDAAEQALRRLKRNVTEGSYLPIGTKKPY